MKTALPSRLKLIASSLAIGLSGMTLSAQAEEVLNFYNWSDYIAEDTIERFEAETGIKVTYDVYDSNETLEAKLLAGNSGYDLVVPSSTFMRLQIAAGIFQPMDRSKLPNFENLDPALLETLANADPGNKYGLPYLWGTTGIGYNVDMVKAALGEDAPVDSLDLIFKKENIEKLADCGVTILDSPNEVMPLVLNYLGKDPNSNKRKDYKTDGEAAQLLKSIRPYVRQFHSSQYINDLANGDICVAIGFSGDVFQAQYRAIEAENGVNIEYTIPKEGAEIWFDMMMIPADAKNAENAHKFINFVMRPDVIAPITEYVAYANPNSAANELVDPEITGNPNIYPSDEVRDRLFLGTQTPPKIAKVQNRTWSDIKTGR